MTFSAYLKEYWEKNPEVKSDQELIHLLQKEYGNIYEPSNANGHHIRENLIGQINSYLTYLVGLPKDSSLSL